MVPGCAVQALLIGGLGATTQQASHDLGSGIDDAYQAKARDVMGSSQAADGDADGGLRVHEGGQQLGVGRSVGRSVCCRCCCSRTRKNCRSDEWRLTGVWQLAADRLDVGHLVLGVVRTREGRRQRIGFSLGWGASRVGWRLLKSWALLPAAIGEQKLTARFPQA